MPVTSRTLERCRSRSGVQSPCHIVVCPYCTRQFDVFGATWCLHTEEPSKVCPHCGRCLCEHPAYQEPHFWKEAPIAFQHQGFQRLFLFYL